LGERGFWTEFKKCRGVRSKGGRGVDINNKILLFLEAPKIHLK